MNGPKVTSIPQLRRVIYDTYANFPTTNLTTGDLAFATDRLVVYRWSGTAWEAISFHSSSGTAANIPAAADLPIGSLYYETDTKLLKQIQAGPAWVAITSLGKSIATGEYTGNGADDRQITVGFKCSLAIVQSATHAWIAMQTPTITTVKLVESGPEIIISGIDCLLHASDGFVVDNLHANTNAITYYYIAIED